MPLRSQAQARYELAHAEQFGGKDRILKKIREAGGLKSLPKRVTPRQPMSRAARDETAKRVRRILNIRMTRGKKHPNTDTLAR